jgi:hypothetical protein
VSNVRFGTSVRKKISYATPSIGPAYDVCTDVKESAFGKVGVTNIKLQVLVCVGVENSAFGKVGFLHTSSASTGRHCTSEGERVWEGGGHNTNNY